MALPAHPGAWGQPVPEWLSLQQAAAIYGVSVDTLRRSISAGELPASRLGVRLIRVRLDDLERLFRPVPTAAPIRRRGRFGYGR
jgi:excisionase family DNA binding protein